MDNTCLHGVESEGGYAVGRASNGSDKAIPYIVKWNGKKWELVDAPKLNEADAQLNDVLLPGVGRDGGPELFVAGSASKEYENPGEVRPLMMTYDGKKWSDYDVSDLGEDVLTDVGPCEDGIVCAAGYSTGGNGVLATFEGGKAFPSVGPTDDKESSYAGVDIDEDTGRLWLVGDVEGKDGTQQGLAAYRD